MALIVKWIANIPFYFVLNPVFGWKYQMIEKMVSKRQKDKRHFLTFVFNLSTLYVQSAYTKFN